MTAHTAITAQVKEIRGPYWIRIGGDGSHSVCGYRGKTVRKYAAEQAREAEDHLRRLQKPLRKSDSRDAIYAAQLENARRNLTLDECRAILDAGTHRELSSAVWSRDTQVNALFALSGPRVTKVGL